MQIVDRKFFNAVYLITVSVILDGFDGTVARLTKTESNFGMQLDSLVDGVTFGLVPAVMIYFWGFKAGNAAIVGLPQIGKVIGFIFLAAGVIRLARFNVLKEVDAFPSNIFVGLPIPLGALSIASMVLIVKAPLTELLPILGFSLYVLLVAILMVSTIKYRTMKKFKSKYNLLILLTLAIVIAVGINFPRYTLPVITALYLVSPVFFWLYYKIRKPKSPTVPIENLAEGVKGTNSESRTMND